jgi:hypothetical protein
VWGRGYLTEMVVDRQQGSPVRKFNLKLRDRVMKQDKKPLNSICPFVEFRVRNSGTRD